MTLCINPRCDKPHNSDNAHFCQNCESALLLKQRYRAMKVLGEGGFGKTYEAADQGAANKVIKVLINNSAKTVELFQREAEVLSQLNHPGIPRVEPNSYIVFHPAKSQDPIHCLVMEKVEGMNLRDYLKQSRQPIDSETANRWLKELVLILKEVHERGILHRDIKPQNIIIKPDGRLALIDFGAVREGTGTEVATGRGGGTEVASHMSGGTSIVSVGYTASEQMNGQAMKQSDFYSLGRTFIFLLTGKEPSTIAYDVYEDVLRWREHAPNVEPKLAELLDQMQSIQVRQRPKNAGEVLDKLAQKSSHPTQRRPTELDEVVADLQDPLPVQGKDIEVDLRITQREAISGVSKSVSFSRQIYANGKLQVESKKLTVQVPAGSRQGTRLRLQSQGNQSSNTRKSGDVYVQLILDPITSPIPNPSLPKPQPKSGILKLITRVLGFALLGAVGTIIFYNISHGSNGTSTIASSSSRSSAPTGYPKAECGTGAGYPVSIRFTSENYDRISKNFCLDVARFQKAATAQDGTRTLQVASFSEKQDAVRFGQLLEQYFSPTDVYFNRTRGEG